MKGQIFSVEVILYLLIILFLLFSFREILLRYSKFLFIKEREMVGKMVLEYKVSEMLKKWTINPNQIDLSKINFEGYEDLEIKIYLSDGRKLDNGVTLECDEKDSMVRILLEKDDNIAVLVVRRCVG